MLGLSQCMDTVDIVAYLVAGVTAVCLVASILLLRSSYIQDKKLRTLEYVTDQFDELERLGSRKLLKQAGNRSVLAYLNSVPLDKRDDTEQILMQYLYAFNRIGTCIHRKHLSEDVVFEIWTPEYFIGSWSKWESFVLNTQVSIGRTYDGFQWLAKVRCPRVAGRYPRCTRADRRQRIRVLLHRLYSPLRQLPFVLRRRR